MSAHVLPMDAVAATSLFDDLDERERAQLAALLRPFALAPGLPDRRVQRLERPAAQSAKSASQGSEVAARGRATFEPGATGVPVVLCMDAGQHSAAISRRVG